jgi:DNA-binding transcriptional MerR regulator
VIPSIGVCAYRLRLMTEGTCIRSADPATPDVAGSQRFARRCQDHPQEYEQDRHLDRRSDPAEAATADNAPSSALMTIGEVAREFGVSLRALRFYELKRLIAPQRHGSNRLYRGSDRERIALILTGRRLGFTLAEIRGLLDRPGGKSLHLTRRKCVEQINALEQQKRGIELALVELRQIYTSFYQAVIEEAGPPARRVARKLG